MSEKDTTSQEIIAEVRKLAEEQPEYIYQAGPSGFAFTTRSKIMTLVFSVRRSLGSALRFRKLRKEVRSIP